MEASLIGCVVLIAEDEPLIALEIRQGFEEGRSEGHHGAHAPRGSPRG
jgi:hypothetical protein